MSVEVWALALNAKVGNPAKKMVLLGLANHADPDGHRCFPSVERLAIYSELGESTVRTKLGEMRSEGLIVVDKRASRYRPTEYSIDLEMLRELRDTDLSQLGVSKSTATSRGPAADAKASSSPAAYLQQTDSRGPAAGGEPSLEPSIETSEEPRDEIQKPSLDQTPLALAKATILKDLNGGKMYARKPEAFELVFEPLKSAGMIMKDGKTVVNLTHPHPEIITYDSRMEAMLRQAFVGVMGGEVEIHIMEETDDET